MTTGGDGVTRIELTEVDDTILSEPFETTVDVIVEDCMVIGPDDE